VTIQAQPVVFVVDDDLSTRDGLRSLIRSAGLEVRAFSSATEFLWAALPDGPACLVLDLRLPDLGGLELQRQLAHMGVDIPIIFISGHGDIPTTVCAMKAGAVEFLSKPLGDQDLLEAIAQAIDKDRAARPRRAELAAGRLCYASLTPRENEVVSKIIRGLLNKEVAADLGITVATVKVHRRHIMEKMQAASLAELVRMVERLA
jgi:FixJ family two-component response regulator